MVQGMVQDDQIGEQRVGRAGDPHPVVLTAWTLAARRELERGALARQQGGREPIAQLQ